MGHVNPTPVLPTIPREVAEAIEIYRKEPDVFTNEEIVRYLTDEEFDNPLTRALRSIPFDTLLAALVNGYTIEMTPEEAAKERVRKYFEWADESARKGAQLPDYRGEHYYVMAAVKVTLNALGIKVEGVNA